MAGLTKTLILVGLVSVILMSCYICYDYGGKLMNPPADLYSDIDLESLLFVE